MELKIGISYRYIDEGSQIEGIADIAAAGVER
jgi:hypothetical protein